MSVAALLTLLLVAPVASPAAQAPQVVPARGSGLDCTLCHGELEFLRQHVDRLGEAEALLVTEGQVAASAHGGQSCTNCHQGFRRWPHPDNATTATCASCHEDAAEVWSAGVHARVDEDDTVAAECSVCHGTHDVAPREALHEGAPMQRMMARCASCHETAVPPPTSPHADSVACVSCHGSHEIRDVDAPESLVAPDAQPSTCGACHEDQAALYDADIHGTRMREEGSMGLSALALGTEEAPPACTTCHGGHDTHGSGKDAPAMDQAAVCGTCHEPYVESFDLSYHGQASALGSELVATCADCHSAHGVYPKDDARSTVNEANLVQTCGTCHEQSSASFVEFQPHADHNDRENYPAVYWTYRLMAALLIGVFAFFGLHSFMWGGRLALDRFRAPRDKPTSSGGAP